MNRLVLSLAIAVLFASEVLFGAELRGCQEPKALADALQKLTSLDWKETSLETVRSIWPRELTNINCSKNGCNAAASQDRIIAGRCECCIFFHFLVPEDGQASGERLQNVVIRHSAASKSEVVEATKLLVAALGLPERHQSGIGRYEEQTFDWGIRRGDRKQLALLEVQVGRADGVWTAFIYIARHEVPE